MFQGCIDWMVLYLCISAQMLLRIEAVTAAAAVSLALSSLVHE